MEGRVRGFLARWVQMAHLAIGIPDYEAYVAHRRRQHPGEPVMSRDDFFRERMTARYRRGTSRCC